MTVQELIDILMLYDMKANVYASLNTPDTRTAYLALHVEYDGEDITIVLDR